MIREFTKKRAALAALVLSIGFAGLAQTATPEGEEAESTNEQSESPAPVTTLPVDTSVMDISSSPSPDAILLSTSLVTLNEIESTIDLPSRARLRESEEDPNAPRAAFTQDELKRIFSDTPRFIYFPEGVDPMIIPWVREAIVAEEKAAEAAVAFAAKDFDKAESIWVEIRERYSNTKQGQEAPLRIVEVQNAREAAARPQIDPESLTRTALIDEPQLPVAPVVVLPQWIRENTNGIMLERNGDRVVVVQNEFLKIGDAVPRFAGVTVKDITPSEVTFSFQERDFVLEVVGTF